MENKEDFIARNRITGGVGADKAPVLKERSRMRWKKPVLKVAFIVVTTLAFLFALWVNNVSEFYSKIRVLEEFLPLIKGDSSEYKELVSIRDSAILLKPLYDNSFSIFLSLVFIDVLIVIALVKSKFS